jgi:replicative DNA helicase
VTGELTLPTAPDIERLVLGSIMLDDSLYLQVAGVLTDDQFSDSRNRLIFSAMTALHERGEGIDRITVYGELQRRGEAESCDGLSYLVSLDDGLPRIPNVDSYVRMVREKADLRRVMFVCQRLMDRASSEREDSTVLLTEMAEAALNVGERQGESQTVGEIIVSAGGLDAFLDHSHRNGLATGFSGLDTMTGGLRGGSLVILAARPSMGKTALALNIADRVGQKGGQVAVFSLEMSAHELIDRLMASSALVNSWTISNGRLVSGERQSIMAAIGRVQGNIHIQDKSDVHPLEIHSQCRRIKARGGLSLVVVDYLQLMGGEKRSENRNQEISNISRNLKIMARDLNVPVIVLSQLSRQVESRTDKRPQLSDLRDSGAIEQDADIVGFIYRPEVYEQNRPDLVGIAELIIAKHRNGPVGTIPLYWRKEFTRFDDRTGEPFGDQS